MQFYEKQIRSLADGKAYIEALVDAGMAYHLEDDPADVLWTRARMFDVSPVLLHARAMELYDLNWGKYECPIGYMMSITGG